MNVVNCSSLPRTVFHEGLQIILEPGDVIQINPFALDGLEDISGYIRRGVFAVYDDEDDWEVDSKFQILKKASKEGAVFKNVNFDDDI